jgi:ADP-ribosylglycohydrolase
LACRTTHHHPEALMGAVAVACCSALLARRRITEKPLDFGEILSSLRALPSLQEGPPSPDPEAYLLAGRLARLAEMTVLPGLLPGERSALLADTFGTSLRAIESAPLAIGAAVSAASLREAVEVAVNAGGDTDTQGAMAGGMAGAYFGVEGIPPSWLEVMENKDKGRDYVRHLTRKLAGRAPR